MNNVGSLKDMDAQELIREFNKDNPDLRVVGEITHRLKLYDDFQNAQDEIFGNARNRVVESITRKFLQWCKGNKISILCAALDDKHYREYLAHRFAYRNQQAPAEP